LERVQDSMIWLKAFNKSHTVLCLEKYFILISSTNA